MDSATDLVFILDASTTGLRHFDAMKAFAIRVLSLVAIGTENTRVAVISYDRTPTVWYTLASFSRQFDLLSRESQGALVQASLGRVQGAISRADPGPTSLVRFYFEYFSGCVGRGRSRPAIIPFPCVLALFLDSTDVMLA